MSEPEKEAQEEVLWVARELAALEKRLEKIVRGLPGRSGEADLSDLVDDPDVATEVRRVVECVLTDSLRPAVEDLLAAASYRNGGKRDEEG